jgi:putative AlgH/UPF0301 family transcriptional regulator
MMFLLAVALLQNIGPAKQPSAGQILVATDKSHDRDLAQSVVLLIHSDSGGVVGLILNRPRGKSTYFGGPLPFGTRILLPKKFGDAEQILPGVYMTTATRELNGRFYAGYVGWSPQQLVDEISRALWKVRPGDAAVVFDPHPETLRQRLSKP